jgi:hypothetical protein
MKITYVSQMRKWRGIPLIHYGKKEKITSEMTGKQEKDRNTADGIALRKGGEIRSYSSWRTENPARRSCSPEGRYSM